MKPTREQVREALYFVHGDPAFGFATNAEKDALAQGLGLERMVGSRIFCQHCRNIVTAAMFGDDMPTIEDAIKDTM